MLQGVAMLKADRPAYGLVPMLQVMQDSGIDSAPMLRSAGIAMALVTDMEYRISFDAELQFIRHALLALRRPDAGILVGQRTTANSFGLLGIAGAACETVAEMMSLMTSYPSLAWGCFETSLWRTAEAGMIRFRETRPLRDCLDFLADRDIACCTTILREAVPQRQILRQVRLRRRPPADPSPYAAYFGCDILFAQAEDALYFDAEIWDQRLPHASFLSRQLYETQCRQLAAATLQPQTNAQTVARLLRAMVPVPDLLGVCDQLHVTPRTLQRRLIGEGVTFSALLRMARCELAQLYLRDNPMALGQIAEALNFEDAAAFCHAFKTWTGMPPGRYRIMSRGEAGLPVH
jgi:AraC-like DNA-binding protein